MMRFGSSFQGATLRNYWNICMRVFSPSINILVHFSGKKHKMNSIFSIYFNRINYSCLSVGEMQRVILTKRKSKN